MGPAPKLGDTPILSRIGALLEEAICDSAGFEGEPDEEGVVHDLARMIEPHVQRALGVVRPRYSKQWANAVASGKVALECEPKAAAAFSLFCGRVMGGMR